jgi:MarR family transcriptional regulator for hemolysin
MEQDRFDNFYYHASCALKSIQKLKTKAMIPIGLASAHTMCLRHLYAAPDGLTRTKLVHLCDIDKAQVSRIINDLCARGYVIETEDESINYKKRLKLTPMGREIAEEINALVLRINSYVSRDFTDEEIDVFYRVFDVICERLKESEEIIDSEVESIVKGGRRRV